MKSSYPSNLVILPPWPTVMVKVAPFSFSIILSMSPPRPPCDWTVTFSIFCLSTAPSVVLSWTV